MLLAQLITPGFDGFSFLFSGPDGLSESGAMKESGRAPPPRGEEKEVAGSVLPEVAERDPRNPTRKPLGSMTGGQGEGVPCLSPEARSSAV